MGPVSETPREGVSDGSLSVDPKMACLYWVNRDLVVVKFGVRDVLITRSPHP